MFEDVISIITDNKDVLVPIIFPSLYKNSKEHWNRTIHGLVYKSLQFLMNLDEALFERLVEQYKEEEKIGVDQRWKLLEEKVKLISNVC